MLDASEYFIALRPAATIERSALIWELFLPAHRKTQGTQTLRFHHLCHAECTLSYFMDDIVFINHRHLLPIAITGANHEGAGETPAPLYPLQDFKALYKYCIIIILAGKHFSQRELWKICIINNIRMGSSFNVCVQYVVCYIRFDVFVDMRKDSHIETELWDRFCLSLIHI